MKISEVISESVGGNYLYHSVRDIKTILNILNSGIIEGQPNPEDVLDYGLPELDVVSLSRDQYNRYPYGDGRYQFVIDKDELRKKGIKVKPFSYGSDVAMVPFRAESEERALSFIPAGPPYVVELQVLSPKYITPELQALCDNAGIPLGLMKQKYDRMLSPSELKKKKERDREPGAVKQDYNENGDDLPFAYGIDSDCVVGFGKTKIKVNSEDKKDRIYDELVRLQNNGTKLTKEILLKLSKNLGNSGK